MPKAPTYRRPEMAVFRDLMRDLGSKETDADAEGRAGRITSLTFDLETSPTDEVTLHLDHDRATGMALTLTMFPEESPSGASSPQVAAIVAKWLRDTAARIEGAASRHPVPSEHVVHVIEVEAERHHGPDVTVADAVRLLAEMGWTPPAAIQARAA